jgi:two-component system, NarL family, nitrate/nitrite response regulator NarL
MKARVLLVDDHVLFAEAIRLALESNDIEVVGIVGSGEEALRAVRRSPPDLAVVDIGLPDQSGIVVGSTLLHEYPDMKVLALSALDDPAVVRQALRAGFHGYLIKDTPVGRFIQAVEAVLSGQVVVPPVLAPRVAGARTAEEESVTLLVNQLTSRERQVLQLLVEGASGQAIALSLGISPNTVRTHVQSILTKLQVRSRLQAASFAVRHGVVTTPGQQRHAAGAS